MVLPINPPKQIDDPNDSKSDDWDERSKIPDPDASKPADWDENIPAKIEDTDSVKPEGWLDDEPEYMSDPNAETPVDCDKEMDGEQEAPLIPNPESEKAPGLELWKRLMINNPNYKSKWKPPLIENPNYQGVWKPRKIPNSDSDDNPFGMTQFSAVGLELWSMTSDIYFDNCIIYSEKKNSDFLFGQFLESITTTSLHSILNILIPDTNLIIFICLNQPCMKKYFSILRTNYEITVHSLFTGKHSHYKYIKSSSSWRLCISSHLLEKENILKGCQLRLIWKVKNHGSVVIRISLPWV
uniref:Calnexin n=1 Tax=Erpetoichthys calabaricus TaxID=27687 RepID=A0A8C4SAU7_ERPCA